MKKRVWALVAGVIAAGVLVASAAAAVSFEPTCSLTPSNGTGACGFVGKGDVQSALGYNNRKDAGERGETRVRLLAGR